MKNKDYLWRARREYEGLKEAMRWRKRAECALLIAVMALCLAVVGLAMVLGWL
jgi:hypothetical protein